jgi:phospholipase C
LEKHVFERLLGVEKPWSVERVELRLDEGAVHVYLGHARGTRWRCPECGQWCRLHDHQPERQWRHLDVFQYQAILHAKPPRCEPQIWQHAVIIVTWDDWGGWYDEVLPNGQGPFVPNTTIATPNPYANPPIGNTGLDPYEYGYRVPMLIISPYLATPKVVDHTWRTTASILDFIENTFGVSKGALKTLDNVPGQDDLFGLFGPTPNPAVSPPAPTLSGFPTGDLPTCSDTIDVTAEPVD